jgi:translation initiation factor 2 subunit 2
VVLQHYAEEYIACRNCKGLDTAFRREERLTFLDCAACQASRTVPPIKQGYVAQVGRRKK